MSDHCGLRYFFDKLNLNARQAKWLDMINKFGFEIRYIKGKENEVADALSRQMQVNRGYEFLWDRFIRLYLVGKLVG